MNACLTNDNLEAVPSRPIPRESAPRMSGADHCLTMTEVEAHYQAAKARLLAAQDEKAEAIAEFVQARAMLRLCLEEIWPERGE